MLAVQLFRLQETQEMKLTRIKKCRYDHGNFLRMPQFKIFSCMEIQKGAVKAYLQKRHRNDEITFREIILA